MKNIVKWILVGGAVLVSVIIIALLVIPLFVDLNEYKPEMEAKVSEITGRTFRIGSDLKLSLFPWAGVSFSDLQLGNPEGFDADAFLQVASFEVRVKLLPLLSRNIEVQKFIIGGPHVTLVKQRDGKVNWDFSASRGKTTAPPSAPDPAPEDDKSSELPIEKLAVEKFSINSGTLIYIDQASGSRNQVTDINLDLQNITFENPIQLKMTALVDDHPVSLNGSIGPIGKNPGRGTIPVDLGLSALEVINVNLKGKLVNPADNPDIDLAVDIAPFSLKKLMGKLDKTAAIKTADPKVLENIGLKARVKAGPKAVSVSGGKLKLDDSNLAFSLGVREFNRPNLTFDIDLDQIDLDRYLPPDSGNSSQAGSKKTSGEGAGKSKKSSPGKQKTDYAPLRKLVLNGQVKAGAVVVSKTRLNSVLLKVKAKNGIFRLDPFSLGAYEGKIAGSGVFNVKRKVLASSIQVGISNLQVGPLLRDQMDADILEGVTNASISLKMTGDDPDQIKKTLSGKGQVEFNDGAIVGIDLAGMVRNAKAAFGLAESGGKKPRTDFSELISPFTIYNGVVTTTNTSMKSPFLRVLAAGKADLVKENLNFRITPKLVGTIKGQGDKKQRTGIIVPVLVSGSFTKPKFKPDLKAMASQQIEKEVFEHKEVKKLFKKKELQPYEDTAKDLLKGLFGN